MEDNKTTKCLFCSVELTGPSHFCTGIGQTLFLNNKEGKEAFRIFNQNRPTKTFSRYSESFISKILNLFKSK